MYVTYCTAAKTFSPELLTPEQRYYSDRVAYVSDLAKAAGEDFGVISGELGLVSGPEVYNYDHLLRWDETADMSKKVAAQIKQRNIKAITFWYNKREMGEPGRAVHRYQAVLIEACDAAGIPFSSMPIEEKLGGEIKEPAKIEPGIWHDTDPLTGKPKHAPTKYPPKGVSMNKKAEQTFLLRAQDEKGLWQNVRKSSFLPDLQIKARMLVKKFPAQKVEIVEEHKDEQFPI